VIQLAMIIEYLLVQRAIFIHELNTSVVALHLYFRMSTPKERIGK
jgi:hypothetical protein